MNNIKGFFRARRSPLFVAQATIQERYDLGTGAVVSRRERVGGGATGDAVLGGPQNCVGVVSVSRHIGEGIHGSGAACFRLIWCQKIIDEVKGYHPVDFPQQVVFWNQ